MLTSVAKALFGTQNDRELKSINVLVQKINSLEPQMQALSDSQLQSKTQEFKDRYLKGETLDSLLCEAFAVGREAGKRVLGQRHYDVQLVGGITLHRGRIAEMKTGEGKTLTATLPLYLNALTGKGSHLVTVNDYLAKRDSEHMGRLYSFLGLSTGIISHGQTDRERQKNYGCDITYGTNSEFGFDYLRDNMKFRLEDYVQRELNFAIVDEVDSILIDEARTPLIISGPTDDSSELYYQIDAQVRRDGGLTKDVDYTLDEKSKSVILTPKGIDTMESRMGIKNLYDPTNIEVLHHVNQAIRAHKIFHRDVDYVVRDGEVMIVDEFTGRLMPGRRWSDGLHQAIEAKEGVNIENENQTLATITYQNFFRMYKKLAGMTGTADTEATEFKQIYNLDVTMIPTNKPMIRKDLADVIYKNEAAKFKAVAKQIKELQTKGQPVLVGTVSVEKSELLHQLLKREGIQHSVLNAKQHEREAYIIAQAGKKGSVTISTNMAGRGTDILLGGQPDLLALGEVGPLPEDSTPEQKEEYEQKLEAAKIRWKENCLREREEVKALGGLFILGTERHESRRIDNQLRGRSGRQGDPGGSRFYLSFEDNLLRIFGSNALLQSTVAKMEEDEPIEHKWTTKAIENAQKKVEGHNYDIRKHLLEYDDVMNQQRKVVYAWRKEVLARDNLKEMVFSQIDELSTNIADEFFPKGKVRKNDKGEAKLDIHEVNFALTTLLQRDPHISEADINPFNDIGLKNLSLSKARDYYAAKENEYGSDTMRYLEKMILLTTIDGLWKDHLLAMDHLREGIGLQGYGQKDPLVAYKKEGFRFFQMMMDQINGDVVRKLFAVQVENKEQMQSHFEEEISVHDQQTQQMQYNLSETGELVAATPASSGATSAPKPSQGLGLRQPGFTPSQPVRHEYSDAKAGRNDPCPCGSGKKYKKCHGIND